MYFRLLEKRAWASLPVLGNDQDVKSTNINHQLTLLFTLWLCGTGAYFSFAGNPFLPGYFADPTVSQFDGKFYLYATTDGYGWGWITGPLVCWESADFVHWRHRGPMVPQQTPCAWAPGHAIKAGNRYIMYPSLDGQIYAMAGDSPAGPFTNALGDQPFIKTGFVNAQIIDGEPFEDDDGQRYFYFGNGQCYGMKLGPDAVSVAGEPVMLTPPNYTEGPYVFKRHGKYYLMWSRGNCCTPGYQVHYAMGDSPLGPFHYEADRNPVLQADFNRPPGQYISGPGHHCVLNPKGTDDYYIVYHRHPYPWFSGLNRRVAVDRMEFEADGRIKPIRGTDTGIGALGPQNATEINLALGKQASASSAMDTTVEKSSHLEKFPQLADLKALPCRLPPSGAFDDDFNTRWSAAEITVPQWLAVDLEKPCAIIGTEIYFDFPTLIYSYKIETSLDGQKWELYADHSRDDVMEVPKVDRKSVTARHVRLTILGTHLTSMDVQFWNSSDPALQKQWRDALAHYHEGKDSLGQQSLPVSVWEFRVLGAAPAK
jgi:arabinoxylan arabinofuranohydrolase